MSINSRRAFLDGVSAGIGSVALSAMMGRASLGSEYGTPVVVDPLKPLAVRQPHFPAKAKRVIFLFMYGGPSQVDTFDYKPALAKLHGQNVPESIKSKASKVGGVFNSSKDTLMNGPWEFKQHGQSGLWVSDLLPQISKHVDDLCVIKSLHCDSSNHGPATYQMNTGAILAGRPSWGSWLTYGLGSENANLPGFVLLFKLAAIGGASNWANGFLPAAFQGTKFRHEGAPVFDLSPADEFAAVQRSSLDAIQALNAKHREKRAHEGDLEGRIAAYELAYRMQSEALDVGDLSRESAETLDLYDVNSQDKDRAAFGRMCLQARRLSERGVRVVQIYGGFDKTAWDSHSKNTEQLNRQGVITDQATSALLIDLKRRGLLDETLVIWGGEFGRTPMEQGDAGRNHNPYGFTMWLAGGGVRGGQSIGETDEIGLRAEIDPHPVKNLHATILQAMGLRGDDLFFETQGRPERLTGVAGSSQVIPGVLF
jgi:hypothetical protein